MSAVIIYEMHSVLNNELVYETQEHLSSERNRMLKFENDDAINDISTVLNQIPSVISSHSLLISAESRANLKRNSVVNGRINVVNFCGLISY